MKTLTGNIVFQNNHGETISGKGFLREENGKILEVGLGSPQFIHGEHFSFEEEWILPGGVDPHTHMQLKQGHFISSDSFSSGSLAALLGGTTTIIDFITPSSREESLEKSFEERMKETNPIYCDFSFSMCLLRDAPEMENMISFLRKKGIHNFKTFLAYDSLFLSYESFESLLKKVDAQGGLTTVHAEHWPLLKKNIENYIFKEGDFIALEDAKCHSSLVEEEAVKRVNDIANSLKIPCYIVHVSSSSSLKYFSSFLIGETCPQYLILDDSFLKKPFEESCFGVMSPPLRESFHHEYLWKALKEGKIQTVGTDHCPFLKSQKKGGEKDFRLMPHGGAGVEHRLELLFSEGVLKNRISLERFVEVCATNPARYFGIYPQKGVLREGSDADIVVIHPCQKRKITSWHMNIDENLYQGKELKGIISHVFLRGDLIVKNRNIVMQKKGYFVKSF